MVEENIPKWLTRKIEDILTLQDEELKQYAIRSIIEGKIAESKDRLKDKDIILGIDVMSEAIELEKAMKGGIRGLSTGFSTIDRLTKGLVGGEVTIISARTSVGKTSLALAIASNVAKRNNPVLFVTLEMTQAQLMQRYIAYNGGLVDDEPTEDFMNIAGITFMQKTDRLNPDSIEPIIKNAKENGVQLVILDHLHYFSRGSQTDDVERISINLSRTAKKYDLPIIAIAHTRKDMPGTNKRKSPTIDDIRGASFISQDADIILMLHRMENPSDLEVKVWKNRNAGIDYKQNSFTLKMIGSKITENWL
jgi:replicative DNA helicase